MAVISAVLVSVCSEGSPFSWVVWAVVVVAMMDTEMPVKTEAEAEVSVMSTLPNGLLQLCDAAASVDRSLPTEAGAQRVGWYEAADADHVVAAGDGNAIEVGMALVLCVMAIVTVAVSRVPKVQ
jgi:hypothetical protein